MLAACKPLSAVKVMPRLLFKVTSSVTRNAPPFKVIAAALRLLITPKLLSLLIESTPPLTLVVPVYVLLPERMTVPVWLAPLIAKLKPPAMMPP